MQRCVCSCLHNLVEFHQKQPGQTKETTAVYLVACITVDYVDKTGLRRLGGSLPF